MTRSLPRRLARYAARGALAALLLLLLYITAALAGAMIARNRSFVAAQSGVTIWVSCSDIHSDIVVPVKNDHFDWTRVVARTDAGQVDDSFERLAIGWGDRRFYLETPTWSDVKIANVFSAFCGLDETAMHIDWLKGDPRLGPQCRSVTLTPEQYKALCTFMSASFALTKDGRSIPIDAPGYTKTDAFYEAEGHYSAIQTCNTWTGQALSAAGIKMGVWTPMKWGVMWQLPDARP